MKLISNSFTFTSLSLDSWSETYIGARWLIENVLPEEQHQSTSEHGAISQMVLLASHHMVEIMLFSCIKESLENSLEFRDKLDRNIRKLEGQSFYDAFEYWSPKLLNGRRFPIDTEPFISMKRLRIRRNSTIHKESSLSSLEMARSALFTGLKGSEEIYFHFNQEKEFKYNAVMKKYPLDTYSLFSEVVYPEDYHEN